MSQVCSMLSVVIIGRNEGERLQRCIASVQAMQRGDWEVEILYVDSNSVDHSVTLAEAMGVRTLILSPGRTTAAKGRNAGWRAAHGDVILFLDGDTILHPDFVLHALPDMEDLRVAVVWGHRREIHPETSLYNRVLDLDWVYRPGWTQYCGGDALFRREALEKSGGFDETLIAGEEPELCRRLTSLDYKILHVDRPMTSHDLAILHFHQYWTRALRAGHAYSEVAARFAKSANPLWADAVKRARNRALTLMLAPWVALLLSGLLHTWWPLLLWALGMFLLVARTAWKAQWKSKNTWTLFLYGIHSHLQHIPIYIGQLRYRKLHRSGSTAEILEYK